MRLLMIYLAAVNVIAFAAMGLDKWKARRDKWRIKERTLFLWVILGGSIGGLLGMMLFHHKTRHWYFRFGFPAILLLQLVAVGVIHHYLL